MFGQKSAQKPAPAFAKPLPVSNETERRNNVELREYAVEMPLFKVFANEIKFPRVILDEEFVRSISSLDEQMFKYCHVQTPRFDYKAWATSLASDDTQDDDPYDLKDWRFALYTYWTSQFSTTTKSGNETELRGGTDFLFRLAFQQRRWRQSFKTERKLFLPASPNVATADILITMPLPNSWGIHLTSLGISHIYTSEMKFGDVVTFVAVVKSNLPVPAQRQLALCLCSAQHQRQALGFDDGHIFGATVVGKILTVYYSRWDRSDRENGKVVVYPLLPTFNLDNFAAFIKCYTFLCKVADYVANEVDNVFKEWETEDGRSKFQERSEAVRERPWRDEPTDDPASSITSEW